MSDLFKSFETGRPFKTCCDCGCRLLEKDYHMVSQSFVHQECVFEFAICLDCKEKMDDQLSEKSRTFMLNFLQNKVDMQARIQELGEESETKNYISQCISCQRQKNDMRAYTLGAIFYRENLLKGPYPLLICDKCEFMVSESISDQTRGIWDRFIGENFPGPPSETKLPDSPKPVFI